jgi:hypothetical protein
MNIVGCQKLYNSTVYRMSGDFMSVLQDLIPEVILSQKCHEHRSDSQQLHSYGYLKIKIHASFSIENSVM